MKLIFSLRFKKFYKKLPQNIKKRTNKQLIFLEKNFYHPSLRTKKLSGYKNCWEFRISRGYRMTGYKENNSLILHTIGPHDIGLGQK